MIDTQRRAAGAQAGWLLIASGTLTAVNNYLPGSEHLDKALLNTIGAVAVAIGLACLFGVPWSRLHERASLALIPVAFGLIAVADKYGGVSAYSYAVYYVVVFAWMGLHHPPKLAFLIAPLAAAAYVYPGLTTAGKPTAAVSSVTVAIPVCILVAEVVSRTAASLRATREESARRAQLLATAATAARSVSVLDSEQVLDAVADAVLKLGFDGVNFARYDDAVSTFRITNAKGLTIAAESETMSDELGMPGLVKQERRLVEVANYRTFDKAIPAFREAGYGSALAVPVVVNAELVAALSAGRAETGRFSTEEKEAFELLATLAERALENARTFATERSAKEYLEDAALRDELTGLGNRRFASSLLKDLEPGQGVALLDLDHFKRINDTFGHASGDDVLRVFGGFLTANVREGDRVARYGGEEFLLVLVRSDDARAVVERLMDAWRSTAPVTTFSAGVAEHETGVLALTTLAKADRALYRAKELGRDRACVFEGRTAAART